MLLIRTLGCALVGLALIVTGTTAGDKKEPAKDKGSKEEAKIDPSKDPRAVKGTVLDVDLKKNAFTLETRKGDEKAPRTFKVTKETDFWGPRGGRGEGLKDDRMAKGYEVIVIPSDDGATARAVHLAYRKPIEEKKKTTKEKTKEKK